MISSLALIAAAGCTAREPLAPLDAGFSAPRDSGQYRSVVERLDLRPEPADLVLPNPPARPPRLEFLKALHGIHARYLEISMRTGLPFDAVQVNERGDPIVTARFALSTDVGLMLCHLATVAAQGPPGAAAADAAIQAIKRLFREIIRYRVDLMVENERVPIVFQALQYAHYTVQRRSAERWFSTLDYAWLWIGAVCARKPIQGRDLWRESGCEKDLEALFGTGSPKSLEVLLRYFHSSGKSKANGPLETQALPHGLYIRKRDISKGNPPSVHIAKARWNPHDYQDPFSESRVLGRLMLQSNQGPQISAKLFPDRHGLPTDDASTNYRILGRKGGGGVAPAWLPYLRSWGASLFEAYMPALIHDEDCGVAGLQALRILTIARLQGIAYARGVWGPTPASDPGMAGDYREFGVQGFGRAPRGNLLSALALCQKVPDREALEGYAFRDAPVIAPHGIALALIENPGAAADLLRALSILDPALLDRNLGFVDALHVPKDQPLAGTLTYRTLDQAMLTLALAHGIHVLAGGAPAQTPLRSLIRAAAIARPRAAQAGQAAPAEFDNLLAEALGKVEAGLPAWTESLQRARTPKDRAILEDVKGGLAEALRAHAPTNVALLVTEAAQAWGASTTALQEAQRTMAANAQATSPSWIPATFNLVLSADVYADHANGLWRRAGRPLANDQPIVLARSALAARIRQVLRAEHQKSTEGWLLVERMALLDPWSKASRDFAAAYRRALWPPPPEQGASRRTACPASGTERIERRTAGNRLPALLAGAGKIEGDGARVTASLKPSATGGELLRIEYSLAREHGDSYSFAGYFLTLASPRFPATGRALRVRVHVDRPQREPAREEMFQVEIKRIDPTRPEGLAHLTTVVVPFEATLGGWTEILLPFGPLGAAAAAVATTRADGTARAEIDQVVLLVVGPPGQRPCREPGEPPPPDPDPDTLCGAIEIADLAFVDGPVDSLHRGVPLTSLHGPGALSKFAGLWWPAQDLPDPPILVRPRLEPEGGPDLPGRNPSPRSRPVLRLEGRLAPESTKPAARSRLRDSPGGYFWAFDDLSACLPSDAPTAGSHYEVVVLASGNIPALMLEIKEWTPQREDWTPRRDPDRPHMAKERAGNFVWAPTPTWREHRFTLGGFEHLREVHELSISLPPGYDLRPDQHLELGGIWLRRRRQ